MVFFITCFDAAYPFLVHTMPRICVSIYKVTKPIQKVVIVMLSLQLEERVRVLQKTWCVAPKNKLLNTIT